MNSNLAIDYSILSIVHPRKPGQAAGVIDIGHCTVQSVLLHPWLIISANRVSERQVSQPVKL